MILTTLLSLVIVLSLLLINNLGIYGATKKRLTGMIKSMVKAVYSKEPKIYLTDIGVTSLKFEAQKVNEFNGDYDQWTKWKSRTDSVRKRTFSTTECAF